MTRIAFSAVLKSAIVALFLVGASAPAFAAQATSEKSMAFDSEQLSIQTAKGTTHKFTVELALTEPQLEFGLMYRKNMPADHGMLFDFGQPRPVMMWMKNTVLPLDMLFLDKSGVITHIQENAVPYSEAIISSEGAVLYVIELNAGTVKKLGLAVGDKVTSATISSKLAK
ncbi:DUF192 domain-containing protein [Rhizobium calliandrae]|uniref:DUF192 domain-containing protein n=1 Tax=Rhizobium calliandrae TaxID=1312182 RepID=A0ABT7KQQ9_9HYPH|nr:DUF192 domain-containing protein [Rhizobium calliandrae]MDL2410447.1 DUF192 domain-containing protein [Rhizobium calliandrae]